MRYWLIRLVIFVAFLYSFLLNTNYVRAEQLTRLDIEQFNTYPVMENLAVAENNRGEKPQEDFWRFRELVKGTKKLQGLFTLYSRENFGDVFFRN